MGVLGGLRPPNTPYLHRYSYLFVWSSWIKKARPAPRSLMTNIGKLLFPLGAGKDHPSGGGLQDFGYGDGDFLVQIFVAVFHHHHRAVF